MDNQFGRSLVERRRWNVNIQRRVRNGLLLWLLMLYLVVLMMRMRMLSWSVAVCVASWLLLLLLLLLNVLGHTSACRLSWRKLLLTRLWRRNRLRYTVVTGLLLGSQQHGESRLSTGR